MAKNPYEVLGISENASADEIKKAYRKKARENHPDLNPNDAAAAKRMNEINEAYDRLSNPEKYARSDAYSNQGASRNPYGGYGSSRNTGYGGYGSSRDAGYDGGYGQQTGRGQGGGYGQQGTGWSGSFDFDDLFGFGAAASAAKAVNPEVIPTDTPEIQQAISYINAGQHKLAIGILNTVISTGRNARWYYLSALANNGAGNSLTALEQIRTAVRMDPDRLEYQNAQRSFQQSGETYQYEGQARGFNMSGMLNQYLMCCCIFSVGYPFCRMMGSPC